MSEQQLKDFAEVAKRRVPVPDLDSLASRGRDLRRLRMAAATGALALVVVVGGVLSSVTRDDRMDRPAGDPTPDIVRELDPRSSYPDPDLLPGQRYAVRPWTLEPRDVRAEFKVPGTGWLWRGDGAVKLRRPGDLGAIPRKPYAAVAVMRADRLPRGQCRPQTPPWQGLDQVPETAARQIEGVHGVRLEDQPRPAELSGYPAVHLRLSVPRLCAEFNDIILWSLYPAEFGGENGVAAVFYPGQQLDVWLVDVEGTMLIVYSELSPGLPRAFRDETRALTDSIVLEPVD